MTQMETSTSTDVVILREEKENEKSYLLEEVKPMFLRGSEMWPCTNSDTHSATCDSCSLVRLSG